jgi:hypothetical protein
MLFEANDGIDAMLWMFSIHRGSRHDPQLRADECHFALIPNGYGAICWDLNYLKSTPMPQFGWTDIVSPHWNQKGCECSRIGCTHPKIQALCLLLISYLLCVIM